MTAYLNWGALLHVEIGGTDRTADLVASGEIDRELDASGIATLYLAADSAPPAKGATVLISGICAVAYVGTVSTCRLNDAGDAWEVRATDGLQALFEGAATLAADGVAALGGTAAQVETAQAGAILALLPSGAIWHRDLHGAFTDGWSAAQDALETVCASVYIESGTLHAVDWAGTGYTRTLSHEAGDLYEGSETAYDAEERELVAEARATVEVRYSRWHHWQMSVGWAIPGWDFCAWVARPFPLPTRQMVGEVIGGNSWSLVESGGLATAGDGIGIYTQGLPASGPQCGSIWNLVGGMTDAGFVWSNQDFGTPSESVWHASWKMARRWAQTLTETYHLAVAAPAGTPGATVADESASHDAPSDDTGWDASAATRLPSGPSWTGGGIHIWADQIDPANRTAVLEGILRMLAHRVRASQRRNTQGCTVEPGSEPALGSRVRILGRRRTGTGQVVGLVTKWDIASHWAGCQVTIARSSGSAAEDLSAPETPDMSPVTAGYTLTGSLALGTHVGGLSASEPVQDDAWDGWISQVQTGVGYPVEGSQTYRVGFTLSTPDVPAAARDEQAGSRSHRIEIDPLGPGVGG